MFPPGKSVREISRQIWGFEISLFPGNLCRDPRNFLYCSKDFRSTDIYHFDTKNTLEQILIFLRPTTIFFSKFAKFFETKCL